MGASRSCILGCRTSIELDRIGVFGYQLWRRGFGEWLGAKHSRDRFITGATILPGAFFQRT